MGKLGLWIKTARLRRKTKTRKGRDTSRALKKSDFTDENGNDCMKETVQANYRRIKEDVKQIVADELERIVGDENLEHLLQQKG